MRELRSGVRRGRLVAAAAKRSTVGAGEMVIRRRRTAAKKKQQQEQQEQQEQLHQLPIDENNHNNNGNSNNTNENDDVYLRGCSSIPNTTEIQVDKEEEEEMRGFDEVREIAEDVVGDMQMDGYEDSRGKSVEKDNPVAEEDEGNTTPLPDEEAREVRKRSAIAQMALRINDEMSAKKRNLEKGLMRKTRLALHDESSSSHELYDEMHDSETTKPAKVLNNTSKQKSKEKVVPLPKETPVAENEVFRTTRSGKRKISAMEPEQPILEHDLEEEHAEQLESQLSMKRNVRGSTTLPHITNTKTRVRKVVEYNEHGQPIGQFSAELASYMGVLARQMVPIVHEKWKSVPNILKEELWRRLEVKYVLEPMSKKLLVNGIGDKWRSFKSTLTRKYVLPFKDEPDRLVQPPPMYRFIKQEHWDAFVKSRLNDEFQALHKAQSERRGKNIYPHRLGRTGYAGLIEKMKKSEGITPDQLDRCLLWKKARQNKNGEYDDDVTREQAEIIDELKKQVEDGSLVCDGNIDVLTLALGTPEHSGRVRGAGKFVSQSAFFQTPRRQSFKVAEKLDEQRKLIENKWQEERVSRLRVEDQLLNTQDMVSRLEETLAHFMQNGKSPTSTSNKVYLNNNETLGKSPTSTSNRVMSTSNRVYLNNNEALGKSPTTNSNRVTLTSNRVSLNNNETLGKSLALTSNRVSSNNNETSTSASSQSMAWKNHTESLAVFQMPLSDPKTRLAKDSKLSAFQTFYNRASQRLTGSVPYISVPVDAVVFGTDMELYLDLDDIRYLCQMEDLSANCIMVYMRHLYDKLTLRRLQEKYEFINPASVSSAKDDDVSKIITERLQNTKCEWVLLPYNPEGEHWLLVVINMLTMSCYWLDPLGLPTRYNIKPFVTVGLKCLQKDGVRRPSPIWYNIKIAGSCFQRVLVVEIVELKGEPSVHIFWFMMCLGATASRALKLLLHGVFKCSDG
ncbi:hypothetical protein BVC80_7577g2 [Macleaya cordata]|uniref:Uncharacterized protein n=1 Tax=Macleaya cordata TaxID=56857 RepID=A0A200QK67_MACCD|nr:hypothetical protein BVC80_7577g2 [Macleaya cordata]